MGQSIKTVPRNPQMSRSAGSVLAPRDAAVELDGGSHPDRAYPDRVGALDRLEVPLAAGRGGCRDRLDGAARVGRARRDADLDRGADLVLALDLEAGQRGAH